MDQVPRRAILHIGTHKTGTTSFQHWLRIHHERLALEHGIDIYEGLFQNNREIALLCADGSKQYPTMRRIPEWNTEHWQRYVTQHVLSQVEGPAETLVIASETLSFLRNPAELSALAELLTTREVTVVVTLRERNDYLRSWAEHLTRDGFTLSDDPNSFAYVQPDSWLADYDSLLAAYRNQFGQESVRVVDYEAEIRAHTSVIPGIMKHVVATTDNLPEWHGVFKNSSKQFSEMQKPFLQRVIRRLTRR